MLEDLRKTEVQQLHRAVRSELDIRRLEIAVNNPSLVRCFQGFRDLSGNWQRFIDWDRSFPDSIRQRRPFDQFEYEDVHPVRLLEPMNGTDVRMVQRREDLRLSSEASEPIVIRSSAHSPFCRRARRRARSWQDLECDVAAKSRVARAIDFAHAASADRLDDLKVCRDDVTRMEPVSGQQDASIEKPVVLGIRAQHTLDLVDQGRVARAGALDIVRALGRRAIQCRFEDVAQAAKLVRADGTDDSRFVHRDPLLAVALYSGQLSVSVSSAVGGCD